MHLSKKPGCQEQFRSARLDSKTPAACPRPASCPPGQASVRSPTPWGCSVPRPGNGRFSDVMRFGKSRATQSTAGPAGGRIRCRPCQAADSTPRVDDPTDQARGARRVPPTQKFTKAHGYRPNLYPRRRPVRRTRPISGPTSRPRRRGPPSHTGSWNILAAKGVSLGGLQEEQANVAENIRG